MTTSKFFITPLNVLCLSALLFCSCKQEEWDHTQEMYYHLELTVEPEEGGNISLSSGDYPAGTAVSIEAVPAAGYVFEGWRGSVSGSANPLTLTMDSDKSLTAVFVKNKYAFNLTIVGPGVVDEYLVEDTRTTVEHGTKILLKAIPDEKGSIFKGWSGDLSGNEQEILIEMGQALNITATFDPNNKTYPLPDLTLPSSMHKELYYGEDFTAFSMTPTFFLPVDYNRDGYLDVVVCDSDFSMEKRNLLRFYKRMKNGSYEIDDVNSNRFEGLIYGPRNSFYGDFNGDGITDICFVGHGIDEYPWPGESPIILFGSGSGAFTMERLTQVKGYFHGSCAGDFDNDGDLDIFLLDHSLNSCFLINDGNGRFSKVPVFHDSSVLNGGTYTAAMYDLNHDGFLDLFVGGHEHEDNNWESLYRYTNTTRVFWGNGKSFDGDNLSRLPRFKDGYGVILDYLFYDLDEDGQEEIINVRTGDGNTVPFYEGWSIQIVKYSNGLFQDVTDLYVSDADNSETEGPAVVFINMEEIDGEIFLCGRIKANAERLYLLKNRKLSRVSLSKDKYPRVTSGLLISAETRTMQSGWEKYDAFVFGFQNGVDLSYLVEEEYVLEFYLKNTDPGFTFDIHFEADALNAENDNVVYGASVNMSSLKHDGSWERIRIPLKDIDLWADTSDSYWNRVFQFVIITTSTSGQEFSVKDIRIRKIIPDLV